MLVKGCAIQVSKESQSYRSALISMNNKVHTHDMQAGSSSFDGTCLIVVQYQWDTGTTQ